MMTKNWRRSTLVAAAALLFVATACSSGTDNTQPDPKFVDTSIFEAGGHVNAFMYAVPAEMARERSTVVSGEIVGIRDGYEILEEGAASEGYDVREHSVVLEIRVADLYKGSRADLDSSGSIFVTLSRGAQQEGVVDDEGGPSTVVPVSAFEKAIPLGSEVIVMADPVQFSKSANISVIDPNRGLPEDGVLLAGLHPQALTFPTREGGTSAWGNGWTLEDVQAQLDAAF
ncbi:hypothetical protein DJ010_08795 [Nocardioides silvaticus]|uniref:Uncharacterized protein n=1 Tax=Nocardioides silvaticus TaxID=2201891 RepID=A0A316THD2_9ACTN|nr:hypothetical protein [Nocardioides silvaticus]PWN03208.1 hypothetical protein DJ010_08795 [Nocardioides silvaticus]